MNGWKLMQRAALATALFTCSCHSIFGLDEFSEAESDDTEAGVPTDGDSDPGATEASDETELETDPTDVTPPEETEPDEPDAGVEPPFEPDAGPLADGGVPDASERPDAAESTDADVAPSECDLGCPDDAPLCVDGRCAQCVTGQSACIDGAPARCGDDHRFELGDPCVGSVCAAGECVVPSCEGLSASCGASLTDDCCRTLLVEGGEFDRNANPNHRVVVSSFQLDKYEVTVGRFRQFLAALPDGSPSAGDGAYPRVPGSGWQTDWPLPQPETIAAALDCYEDQATWTDEPGDNENRPINCVTWYEAFAFCAWDGGYLPTETQWDYAALGGDEARYYPWSDPPISDVFGAPYSNYYCDEFTPRCFDPVGALPLGDGRYGQSDLGGNTREWVRDDFTDDYLQCESGVNCLTTDPSAMGKIVRGGSVGSGGSARVVNTLSIDFVPPLTRYPINGFRCARATPQEASAPAATEDAATTQECQPGMRQCSDGAPALCDESGRWVSSSECAVSCDEGYCTQCSATDRGCDGNVPLGCGDDGYWLPETACAGDTPVCSEGECVEICAARHDCGPEGTDDCCETLTVPGGSSNRNNDVDYPSSVSEFELSRFEVSVGRFREFVDAYPSSRPAAGDGAHPSIVDSGWDVAWNEELPETRQGLIEAVTSFGSGACTGPRVVTYTAEPGANEARAMNCVTWYEAFAFCAWAGGRLPTLAEHSFATVGGDEQRAYPWADPMSDDLVIDVDFATYGGLECPTDVIDDSPCISTVGSKPLGNGRFGHADLVGNVAEYVLDAVGALPTPCVDCANIAWTSSRYVLGGAYVGLSGADLTDDPITGMISRSKLAGIRCVMP